MKWAMLLVCPKCLNDSVIEQGEAIECKKCHAKPKILWDGRAGVGIHILGETVEVN